MTPDRARHLIGHWPEDARYLMNERWSIMDALGHNEAFFWKAVTDTRNVWARTWDLSIDKVAEILSIKNEEKERATWNKLQAELLASQQQRLY